MSNDPSAIVSDHELAGLFTAVLPESLEHCHPLANNGEPERKRGIASEGSHGVVRERTSPNLFGPGAKQFWEAIARHFRCAHPHSVPMNPIKHLSAALLLGAAVCAQSTAIFPAEYSGVPEGPTNSANLPLALGTSRVMCVYNQLDLAIPVGTSIRKLGFRQDQDLTTLNAGRSLQLEVRMGYTANSHTGMSSTFDTNYVGTPVTVFGPALFTLPNLRDPAAPLPNGRFFLNLTTPFPYNPGANNLVVEYRIYGTSGGGNSFTYYLDRADYFSPVVNGPAGCAHLAGGPPVLATTPVSINSYYTASISQAPANSLSVLVLSLGGQLATPFSLQSAVPGIAPSCMGQVTLAGAQTLTTFTNSGGAFYSSFYLPNTVLLNDLYISSQAAFFDFFAPGGVVVSNGAQVQVGIPPRSTTIYAQGPPATTTTGSVSTYYCPVAFFEYQ